MRENKENSFNIDFARHLSLRLTGSPDATLGAQSSFGAADYISFPAPEARAAAPPRNTAPPEASAVKAPQGSAIDFGQVSFDSWDGLLEWSATNIHSQAEFVVDMQGFIIAQHGDVEMDWLEDVAIKMSDIMDHLEKNNLDDSTLQGVEIYLSERRVLAFLVNDGSDDKFVFGLLGGDPLTEESRRAFYKQVGATIANG